MNKANEPAYPLNHDPGTEYADGLSKRDKLAMEIYAKMIVTDIKSLADLDGDELLITCAKVAISSADIFFEQLNK